MMIKSRSTLLVMLLLSTVPWLTGCDPEHLNKCEWYLVPEPNNPDKPSVAGNIPVCARNFETNRQYCRLQAPFEFTKKNFKRKFKYNDMRLSEDGGFPRTVKGIKFCD